MTLTGNNSIKLTIILLQIITKSMAIYLEYGSCSNCPGGAIYAQPRSTTTFLCSNVPGGKSCPCLNYPECTILTTSTDGSGFSKVRDLSSDNWCFKSTNAATDDGNLWFDYPQPKWSIEYNNYNYPAHLEIDIGSCSECGNGNAKLFVLVLYKPNCSSIILEKLWTFNNVNKNDVLIGSTLEFSDLYNVSITSNEPIGISKFMFGEIITVPLFQIKNLGNSNGDRMNMLVTSNHGWKLNLDMGKCQNKTGVDTCS